MRRNTNNHNARYHIINAINMIESADGEAGFYRKKQKMQLKDSQMIPTRPWKMDFRSLLSERGLQECMVEIIF